MPGSRCEGNTIASFGLARGGSYIVAHANLGVIHMRRKQWPQALVRLRKAEKLAPTVAGIRLNIDVGIRYLASWMCGNGCVPIYSLMEDAARRLSGQE